jgi:hypothetical protein
LPLTERGRIVVDRSAISRGFAVDATQLKLQPRIDWLGFESEHTEYAFVNSTERLAADEALERFDAQCELPQGK